MLSYRSCTLNKDTVQMWKGTIKKEALIKNKISTNMMVKEGYIQDVDEYTEHVNALFNSLIRSADNILQD